MLAFWRGYEIHPAPAYTRRKWEYVHQDYDGPEDGRHGVANTIGEVMESICHLEDWCPGCRTDEHMAFCGNVAFHCHHEYQLRPAEGVPCGVAFCARCDDHAEVCEVGR